MEPKRDSGRRTTGQAARLRSQRHIFLEQLREQGYAPATIRTYDSAIDLFCRQAASQGLDPGRLDGPEIEAIREAVVNETSNKRNRTHAPYCVKRFFEHLVRSGVAAAPEPPPAKEPTAMDRLREEYADYLRRQRSLSEASITHCLHFLRRFMAFRFGETLGDLNAIEPDDVIAFLTQLTARRDKTPPTHLRNLFKFLFWSGKTTRNLANSVPRVARPQAPNQPRYLKPEEVQRLIDAVRSDDAVGRRNYAMLLLIARLGLRAPEVIAVRLEDIDWRAGEILVRGKGKLHDRMPLPAEVGEAIVDYIRNGRSGKSRALFLTSRPPFPPFKNAQVLNYVLRSAFEKTGLKPPQSYVGSHLLRHSLATDMLRKGASLDEIGDVLRHRSRMSTTIYAKYDIDSLRSIARPWPAGGGAR